MVQRLKEQYDLHQREIEAEREKAITQVKTSKEKVQGIGYHPSSPTMIVVWGLPCFVQGWYIYICCSHCRS